LVTAIKLRKGSFPQHPFVKTAVFSLLFHADFALTDFSSIFAARYANASADEARQAALIK
jgi:hypothetical protein